MNSLSVRKALHPKRPPPIQNCAVTVCQDLDILDQREKIPFHVSAATRAEYAQEVIPFWQGKTMRERIFAEMTPEWKAAYEAGIFTEFMEQRAPGHTVLDDKIYHTGMLDFHHRYPNQPGRTGFPERSARVRPPGRTEGHGDLRGCTYPFCRAAMPSKPAYRPPAENRPQRAKPNWSKSPQSASTFRPTHRAPCGRRCNITGLSTWA